MMQKTLFGTVLLASLALAGCTAGNTEESSIRRGDQAFAQGNYEEALAEYRLAVAQGADDGRTIARVAHTFAIMDRADDAGTYYADATARDSTLIEQAVSDLLRLARAARERGDGFAMASAVGTALRLRPGLGVGDLSLDLAQQYFRSREYGRALPYFQQALAEGADSSAAVVFEFGQVYEEIGDCTHALVFFERFREMVRPWERAEVEWHIGTCAYNLARQLRTAPSPSTSQLEDALSHLDRVLEVGEPRNLQAPAWFDKGEILSTLGRCDEAMDSFAQVRYADNAGALLRRAQDRFDEIRFGRGLESRRGRRCR